MNNEILSWWVIILTVIFILESSFLIYFMRWVLWRCNTALTELLIEKRLSDKEED